MMISKNDYKILATLKDNNYISEINSCTIRDIMEFTKLSTNKVRTAIKLFKALTYISEGAAQHSSKTYYITKSGIEKLGEI